MGSTRQRRGSRVYGPARGHLLDVPPPGGDKPTQLNPGDVVFSPHGHGYGLANTPVQPSHTLHEARPGRTGSQRFTFGEPSSRPPVVYLAGGYGIHRERTHPLLNSLPNHVHLPAGGTDISRVLEGLDEEITTSQPGTEALHPLLLDTLLVYVLRACLRSTTDHPAGGWARALADPGLGTALAAMHQNPAHTWTVTSLAEEAHMSRATFARRFTDLTGLPPMTYLSWWRMNLAQSLLRETDLPIEMVANRVGYNSPYAFSHAFKRTYTKPPLRYRRESTHPSGPPASPPAM